MLDIFGRSNLLNVHNAGNAIGGNFNAVLDWRNLALLQIQTLVEINLALN